MCAPRPLPNVCRPGGGHRAGGGAVQAGVGRVGGRCRVGLQFLSNADGVGHVIMVTSTGPGGVRLFLPCAPLAPPALRVPARAMNGCGGEAGERGWGRRASVLFQWQPTKYVARQSATHARSTPRHRRRSSFPLLSLLPLSAGGDTLSMLCSDAGADAACGRLQRRRKKKRGAVKI